VHLNRVKVHESGSGKAGIRVLSFGVDASRCGIVALRGLGMGLSQNKKQCR
jgi:hypothetical protein